MLRTLSKPSLNWLLIFIPIATALKYLLPNHPTFIFFAAALAIVPLAGLLGDATGHLARRTTQGIGGLLNATFGNAAELIISLFALANGLRDVVKASITGSIIGNLLLVLGASILAGGAAYKTQKFNQTAARVRATMLGLAAIALIMPAAYDLLAGPEAKRNEADLSAEISVVLFVTYLLGLLFSLKTHKDFFSGRSGGAEQEREGAWSIRKSLAVLAGSTVLVGWISEILAGSIEQAAKSLGITSLFVGMIVVGIAGNAAEHYTAIVMAKRDKMDLTVTIAIDSSIQIALFVAPILVFASYVVGPKPMDLVFTMVEVLVIGLAVWITALIAGDGESNWLEGVQLIAVYLVIAIVIYFIPEHMLGSSGSR